MFTDPSHTCASVRASGSPGMEISLAGWVDAQRDHGEMVFLELRDGASRLQLVTATDITPEALEAARAVRPESTVWVSGRLRARPQGTENAASDLGHVELEVRELRLLSRAAPLPFPLADAADVGEAVLLKHRYLHLRTPRMQRNLKLRAALVRGLRDAFAAADFTEVETPLLFKSTPEGARDFLVPSRLHPGNFYALVQSPQMLKQLLMVGGLGRYMQLTRCFRDEDLRADRQPEFTQLDLEASFVSMPKFMDTAEYAVRQAFATVSACAASFGENSPLVDGFPATLPRIPYEDAVGQFGSDKPDLRFGLPLRDATAIFAQTQFETFRTIVAKGGLVKFLALPAPASAAAELPRSFLERLPALAKQHGGQGLAWIRIQEDGSWQGPAAKFFADAERAALLAAALAPNRYVPTPDAAQLQAPGAMLFFAASLQASVVHDTLGALRLALREACGIPHAQACSAFWVVDWPLFTKERGEREFSCAHHPFTAPAPESERAFAEATRGSLAAGAYAAIRAQAFDLVINGSEVGGGSARIFDAAQQAQMFALLGMTAAQVQQRFGFFLEAFRYGVPPHVGMALGVDRLAAMLAGEPSIRDVIAFPKTGTGACLMSSAPSPVEARLVREAGVQVLGE